MNGVTRQVAEAGGMSWFRLGDLRDAYLADHPELERKKLSRDLVDGIRSDLDTRLCFLWPRDMTQHRQDQNVYVISKNSKPGNVLLILDMEPNAVAARVLCKVLDEAPQSAESSSG